MDQFTHDFKKCFYVLRSIFEVKTKGLWRRVDFISQNFYHIENLHNGAHKNILLKNQFSKSLHSGQNFFMFLDYSIGCYSGLFNLIGRKQHISFHESTINFFKNIKNQMLFLHKTWSNLLERELHLLILFFRLYNIYHIFFKTLRFCFWFGRI